MEDRDEILLLLGEIKSDVSNTKYEVSKLSLTTNTKLDAITNSLQLSQIDIKELQIFKSTHVDYHKDWDKNMNKWKFAIVGAILAFVVGMGMNFINGKTNKSDNRATGKNRPVTENSKQSE